MLLKMMLTMTDSFLGMCHYFDLLCVLVLFNEYQPLYYNSRDLHEDLQTEFKKYLETRGITSSTTHIMYGYMRAKEYREKLRCLYKLQEKVEKIIAP